MPLYPGLLRSMIKAKMTKITKGNNVQKTKSTARCTARLRQKKAVSFSLALAGTSSAIGTTAWASSAGTTLEVKVTGKPDIATGLVASGNGSPGATAATRTTCTWCGECAVASMPSCGERFVHRQEEMSTNISLKP